MKIKNKLSGKITSQEAFILLLLLVWARTILIAYCISLIRFIPVIGNFAGYIEYFCFILATTMGLYYIIKRLKIQDYTFMILVLVLYVINIQIYTSTSTYLIENAVYILVVNFSAFFIGIAFDYEKFIDLLYKCSQISLVAILVYFVVFGFSPEEGRTNMENMGLAYRILPHVCLVLYYALRDKKIMDCVLSIVGCVLLIACGVRGGIICAVAFIFVYIIFFKKFKYKWCIIGSFTLLIYLIYINFSAFANILIGFLKNFGLSTRVVEELVNGTVLIDAPRIKVRTWMYEAIKAHPFRGYGIAGDRNLIPSVVYSHEIWTEFWISYGVILGSILLLIIVIIVVRALIDGNSNEKGFILVLIFGGGLFKLSVSSSYLLEFMFFMLIGYCIGVIRRKGIKFKKHL